MSTIDSCFDHNASFAKSFPNRERPAAPARQVAVVTCMDARLDVWAMLGLVEGDAHVIRNAGGIVSEDVIRSLAISQHFLHTREIMVIQHTDCGLLNFSEDRLIQTIEAEAGTRPSFAMGAFPDLEDSLRASVAAIKSSPFMKHTDAVRGFGYAVETGRLREVE